MTRHPDPIPRRSSEETTALLSSGSISEKGQLPQQNTILDVETPCARRKRIVRRHLRLATVVIAGFLLLAFYKHTRMTSFAILRDTTAGCTHAHQDSNWLSTGDAPKSHYDESTADYSFDFEGLDEWQFEELFDLYNIPSRNVHSDIRLQPTADNADKDISVRISVTTNRKDVIQQLESRKSSNGLVFKVVAPAGAYSLCLRVEADIYVKPSLKLRTLSLTSDIASLEIHPGLESLTVDQTNINLHVGSVSASPLNSRETRIDTHSGSVSGTYRLYDLLSVHTFSGSVQVSVAPQAAAASAPAPATLALGTTAGSIDVTYPPFGAKVPARDYDTSVQTVSGSIHGSVVHGSKTSIRSRSGEVAIRILPFAADDYKSTLDTRTDMGSHDVTLLSPQKDPGTQMRRLESSHRTLSGSLRVEYPGEWEGELEGGTKSGSLNVGGKDVRIVERGTYGPIGGWVKAVKGNGESRCGLGSQSGSVDVTVGGL